MVCKGEGKVGVVTVIGLVGRSVFMEVPRFHVGGETIHALGIHEEWGGKGFNQAVAAARQGASVAFLGACAEADVASISDFCRGEGIEPFLIGKPVDTAYAAILTDTRGETRVTVYPGARLDLGDVDVFEASIVQSDFLLLNNEVPEEVNDRAALLAVRHGAGIVCNPAPARPLSATLRKTARIFTPNEFEEGKIGEVPGEVVTTLGAGGCRIRSTGEVIPAVACGKVVDTTGAGDTFNGVLAAGLAEGLDLRSAAIRANAAAGRSVTVRYVMPSIPRL